jgi:hypothetical protein
MVANARAFTTALIGKRVSHAWRGYGSVIFLEFGKLRDVHGLNGKSSGPFGELSLMSGWKWRIDSGRSTLAASWSNERRWLPTLKRLIGGKVRSVKFSSGLPHISISLTNGLRVVSPAVDNFSSWSVIGHQPSRGSLSVNRGKLHVAGRGS